MGWLQQEIDFLAPPKTPMGGPREPKISSVMSLPFLQQGQCRCRLCTTATAGAASLSCFCNTGRRLALAVLLKKP
jgi:hypothetical protein